MRMTLALFCLAVVAAAGFGIYGALKAVLVSSGAWCAVAEHGHAQGFRDDPSAEPYCDRGRR